jgi:hypothetical protein
MLLGITTITIFKRKQIAIAKHSKLALRYAIEVGKTYALNCHAESQHSEVS